jgi:hypothetical protein
LIESWKNYTVSTNPEILLYDFYVVSYLTTLPLDPAQKVFSVNFHRANIPQSKDRKKYAKQESNEFCHYREL